MKERGRENDTGVSGCSGMPGGQTTGAVHEIHQRRPPWPWSYPSGPSPGAKFAAGRGRVEKQRLPYKVIIVVSKGSLVKKRLSRGLRLLLYCGASVAGLPGFKSIWNLIPALNQKSDRTRE